MANVTTIYSAKSLAAYLPEGAAWVVEALQRNLPNDVHFSDGLTLYAFEGISTTKDEVSDTAGARPHVIIAESKGTECYIHLHDADADNVTVGVGVDFLVPVSGTSGEITALFCTGNGWKTFWDTGLTASASTASETSSAPTNPPNLWIIYS